MLAGQHDPYRRRDRSRKAQWEVEYTPENRDVEEDK